MYDNGSPSEERSSKEKRYERFSVITFSSISRRIISENEMCLKESIYGL